MKKYRIVGDSYLGYEIQERYLFLFWIQWNGTNTFSSIEDAGRVVERLKFKKYY